MIMFNQCCTRRDFLRYAGLTATMSLTGCATWDSGKDRRPNIIFILTDDQRADTLGCMGNRIIRTPNIDRLAAQGTLFVNATVTSAVCTASRASMLTGQYERKHGVNFNSGTSMAPEAWEKTYPMLLKKSGYFTAYIGKNHVPVGANGYATGMMDESFDYWYGGHEHLTFYPKERPAFTIKIKGVDEHMFDNAHANTQVEILEEGVNNLLEPNEAFYAGAVRFLKKRPSDRPFCLSLCFNLPHDAGTGTMKDRPGDPELYKTGYHDRSDAILADLPATYVAADKITAPKLPADLLYADKRQKSYEYVNNPESLAARVTRWYQSITGIDNLVGRLRRKLEEMSLADNTVIIFTSDHGIMRGEFELGGKALCYEPCMRVPMIVFDPRMPDSARGQRREELVQSIDIAPTILDFAELGIPSSMQGESMVPLIRGTSIPWREYAFGENLWCTYFGNPRIESVRGSRWKYIRYFKNDRSIYDSTPDIPASQRMKVSNFQAQKYHEWLSASVWGEQPVYEELFDLSADPDEAHNLAHDEKYASVLKECRDICQNLVNKAKGGGEPATLPLPQERLEYYLKTMKHD